MKLLPGATGFNPPSGARADSREFTAICYHAGRAIGGAVAVVQLLAGVTPKLHRRSASPGPAPRRGAATMRAAPHRLRRSPVGDGLAVTYVDHRDLANALTGLTDTRSWPSSSFKPAGTGQSEHLDGHEHSEIKYWKPDTVGDLLFNFWD